MDETAVVLVAAGVEGRQDGRRDFVPVPARGNTDIREHDTTASVHARVQTVRGLERAEGYSHVGCGHRAEFRPAVAIDAAGNVARDPHERGIAEPT